MSCDSVVTLTQPIRVSDAREARVWPTGLASFSPAASDTGPESLDLGISTWIGPTDD